MLGSIVDVLHRVDINSLVKVDATHLELNEIGPCRVKLTQQVCFDSYADNRKTGAFIIIDRLSNITIGAGMIKNPVAEDETEQTGQFSEFELEFNALVRKHFPHWGAVDLKDVFTK